MDREEAKHILSLCRPGRDEDWHDPVIAPALELLESDVELRDWFEAQQAADASIAAELERIQPPAELKSVILAGMRAHKASATTGSPSADNILEFEALTGHGLPREVRNEPRRLSPWIGIAALFAILFVVAVVRLNQQQQSPTQLAERGNSPAATAAVAPDVITFLADQIEGLMQQEQELDMRDPRIAPLTTHLANAQAPVPSCIPNRLHQLPTIGCITFKYNHCKLSMICFKGNQVYHLITGHKSSVDCSLGAEPQFYEVNNQAFRLWSEGEQVFILTVKGTKGELPELM